VCHQCVMKKLAIILIITLLISTKAFSFTFDRCVIETSFPQRSFEEMHKEKFQFRVHIDKGKILETNIFRDEWLAKNDIPQTDKIKNEVYDITYIDEDFIKAQSAKGDLLIMSLNTKDEFNVSAKHDWSTSTFKYKCEINKSKKSSSSYLDYWWAVILIIAITFFIFTQSGKRLKKIRRK